MPSEFFVSEVFFEVFVHDAAAEFREGKSLVVCCGVESLSLTGGDFYAECVRESGTPCIDGGVEVGCRYCLGVVGLQHGCGFVRLFLWFFPVGCLCRFFQNRVCGFSVPLCRQAARLVISSGRKNFRVGP